MRSPFEVESLANHPEVVDRPLEDARELAPRVLARVGLAGLVFAYCLAANTYGFGQLCLG